MSEDKSLFMAMDENMDIGRRAVEATLFASEAPMSATDIKLYVGDEIDIEAALLGLQQDYVHRGISLVQTGNRWHFQTAQDLSHLLRREREELRKLSRAGMETLAIIAYHEPVSRAEIEAIRGVQVAKGTLDVLMEAGWVRPAGRREVPGRPLIYATTGIDDLKAAGLLDPVDFAMEKLELEVGEEQEVEPDTTEEIEDSDAVSLENETESV